MSPVVARGINAAALRAADRREYWGLLSLSFPALTLVSVILFLPTGWLFTLSFVGNDGSFSLEHYARLVSQASYATVFRTTFKLTRQQAKTARHMLGKTNRMARKAKRQGRMSAECRTSVKQRVKTVRRAIPKRKQLKRCLRDL